MAPCLGTVRDYVRPRTRSRGRSPAFPAADPQLQSPPPLAPLYVESSAQGGDLCVTRRDLGVALPQELEDPLGEYLLCIHLHHREPQFTLRVSCRNSL